MASQNANVTLSYTRYPEKSFNDINNIAVLPFQEGTLGYESVWDYLRAGNTNSFLLQLADDLSNKLSETKTFNVFDRNIAPNEPSIEMVIFGLVIVYDVESDARLDSKTGIYHGIAQGRLEISYRFVDPSNGELLHSVKLRKQFSRESSESSYDAAKSKLPDKNSIRRILIHSINNELIYSFTPKDINANFALATVYDDKRFLNSLFAAKSGNWEQAATIWTEFERTNLAEAYYNNMLYIRYIEKYLDGAIEQARTALDRTGDRSFELWLKKFEMEKERESNYKKKQFKKNPAPERFAELQSDLIKVSKDVRGIIISMEAIIFEPGSATLRPDLHASLTNIAKVLIEYRDSKLLIEGHSDNKGSAAFNRKLSEERAVNVMNFLIKEGVAPERLTAIGRGFEMPIADNKTAAGRAQNRRVELIVQEKSLKN
jgi:outer membrane protein OmpA-like peptidoglycan-associated protein